MGKESVSQRPWVAVNEVFDHFGYKTLQSAIVAISAKRFPVPTFKVGKYRAIHREVYDAYWQQKLEDAEFEQMDL